jgi:NTE family protein
LCLSGGGFRAALYGLGVVRYLAEAGLLRRVSAVSAVSGGAVAAAVLADCWPGLKQDGFSVAAFVERVESPFQDAIMRHSIRNAAVARWAVRRASLSGRSRGSAMGDAMVKYLLRARMVTDLDPGLQVVLTSTDLSTGRAFRVSRDFVGSWDFGYQPVPEGLSLGTAIAASTAVPMLFPPVQLDTASLKLTDAPRVLSLVDGGVYDNLGLEWFQGWDGRRPPNARAIDFNIVVDASGPLVRNSSAFRGLRAISRSREIQYVQTRATRIRWFVDDLIAGRAAGCYLVSKHDPCSFRHPDGSAVDPRCYAGALPKGFASALASVRTDLGRFRPEEVRLLTYHGYWSAHARFASLFPGLGVDGEPRWQEFRDLSAADARRLLALLEVGQRRRPRF